MSKNISDDAIETYLKNIKCKKSQKRKKINVIKLSSMHECKTAIKLTRWTYNMIFTNVL